ncbi:6-phosphogluconolactonase [Fodinicola acaciae]|uniref:6-phosphogluconolactonase n=1 Tax=Fodinicola acaciae TaxID=2681555 RepID=UPI0013D5DB62|nr:6-phosphogluconolactonase [Fodinicola acaciae]
MSADPIVVVHADRDTLVQSVAARLIAKLADAQAARGEATAVLTGGTVGTLSLGAVADSPLASTVDWSRVNLWWGDERFVRSGDADRNDEQVRQIFLEKLPLDPKRIHHFPATDGPDGDDAAAAAARYAEELLADGNGKVPVFDVLMLGVGGEGHVASIFPDSEAGRSQRTVVAVHDSPKPPPNRLSLTFPTITSAEEIWLVVAGKDKAEAVGRAVNGANPADVPAAGAVGRTATKWLVDREAAAGLR